MSELLSLINIKTDLWSYLKRADKPIVLYGMGDGADKILNALSSFDINVSAIFASDEFVRYQSFHGFTVEKYSDVKKKFSEMIILVAFASRLPCVIERIKCLSLENELYAPDVPVFGGGLFDLNYLYAHDNELSIVYNSLSDKQSKDVFLEILRYKLTGNIKHLFSCESTVSESYSNIIKPKPGSFYVDIGAYNGDTIYEYISYAGNDIKISAFEPDKRNFKKLTDRVGQLELLDCACYNIAAWNNECDLSFFSRSGRNSASTSSHKNTKTTIVKADKIDKFILSKPDFIKIDAEGSEREVIKGLSDTIIKYSPLLCIAAYHRNEDFFAIPKEVFQIYPNYELYLRHFPYIPGWDTNFYFRNPSLLD